jgi:hypothetical protein
LLSTDALKDSAFALLLTLLCSEIRTTSESRLEPFLDILKLYRIILESRLEPFLDTLKCVLKSKTMRSLLALLL